MFSWWRNRRRRKLVEAPFPAWWEVILQRNVAHYRHLPTQHQKRLRELTQILVAEKRWEGCGGLTITPEIPVTIAAQAGLLLLGLEHDYFARVPSIIVYPTHFRTPNPEDDWEDDELSDATLSGQAVYRGPVILAWDDVLREGRNPDDGYNVVVHEFAHQLDFSDSELNGTPPLESTDQAERWANVMQVAFDEHRAALHRGQATFFTDHAADDETEFFADASEAFYCRPHDLEEYNAALFELLKGYYKIDPREWFTPV